MRHNEVTPERIRRALPGWAQVYIAGLQAQLDDAERRAARADVTRLDALESRVSALETVIYIRRGK
jgi:hypothetical protein